MARVIESSVTAAADKGLGCPSIFVEVLSPFVRAGGAGCIVPIITDIRQA